MGGILFLPEAEADLAAELLHEAVFEDDELLVRGRVYEELIAFGDEHLFQALGEINGVAADGEIETVSEKSIELHAEEAALGDHRTALLGNGLKVLGHVAAREDDGFAAERTDLRPADIEDVAEGGNVLESDIRLIRGETVAEAGTVQEKLHAVAVTELGELAKLGF